MKKRKNWMRYSGALLLIFLSFTSCKSDSDNSIGLTEEEIASLEEKGIYYDDYTGELIYGGIIYHVDKESKEALIYEYEMSDSFVLEIPEIVEYGNLKFKVTSVAESAFYASEFTKIILPESIESFEAGAFYGCEYLEEINIPSKVKEIPDEAFLGCTSLRSIHFPDSLETIGIDAFNGCYGITELDLPDTVTAIGETAFYECLGLKEVSISSSLLHLPDYVFNYCESLEKVILPDGLLSIGEGAFSDCINLKEIQLPESIIEIGMDAFYLCGFTNIRLPKGLQTEDDTLLSYCENLTTVEVPGDKLSYYKQLFQYDEFIVTGYNTAE